MRAMREIDCDLTSQRSSFSVEYADRIDGGAVHRESRAARSVAPSPRHVSHPIVRGARAWVGIGSYAGAANRVAFGGVWAPNRPRQAAGPGAADGYRPGNERGPWHCARATREHAKHRDATGDQSGPAVRAAAVGRGSLATSLNDLSQRTGTHQSSVSVVVSRLVDHGLVRRALCEGRQAPGLSWSSRARAETVLAKAPTTIQAHLIDAFAELSRRRSGAVGRSAWAVGGCGGDRCRSAADARRGTNGGSGVRVVRLAARIATVGASPESRLRVSSYET